MRKLITLLLFVWVAVASTAQIEQTMTASRDVDADRFSEFKDSYGLLLLSRHDKLKVKISNASKPYDVLPADKPNADGMYEYLVVMDSHDTRDAKVEVHRTGSLYETAFVSDRLRRGYDIAYRIDEYPTPIRIADQTRRSDMVTDTAKAVLEFRTQLKDLVVKCPLSLGAGIKKSVDETDKRIYITTVTIPVAGLMQARNTVGKLLTEINRLNDLILNDKATEDDFSSHDRVSKQLEEAQNTLNEMSSLLVYSDGTNNLSVDVSDIGPHVKRCYLVLPLETKVKVFTKEFQGYLDNGIDCLNKREYSDARNYYVKALGSADCEADIKPAIERNIATCDSCYQYERLAGAAIGRFIKLRDSGTATQQQAYRYASAAIEYLKILNNYNPDKFYTSRIQKLTDVLNNMPLCISFTTVEWQTLNEGDVIPGVEVWAYYGDEAMASVNLMSKELFDNAIKANPTLFKQEGVSDDNGKVVLELDRSKLPVGFFFYPTVQEKGFKFKPAYLDMKAVMLRAKGDFLQKQYRMKMYNASRKHRHI